MLAEIIQAFKYPFVGERYPRRFLFGCVVSLVPLLGNIVSLGYAFKSMQGIMSGDDELPRWEDFIGLFSLGIKVIGIWLVYGVAFLVPFSLGIFCILVIPHVIAVNLGFVLLILSAILFLSTAFIVPMALMFMIQADGSMQEALRFEDVLITIRDTGSTYIIRSFFVWIIGIVCALVMSLIISIPFGHFFALPVAFYFFLIGSYIFGLQGRVAVSYRIARSAAPGR